jgi:uncharacterized cupredoxin-like copper-binding protein
MAEQQRLTNDEPTKKPSITLLGVVEKVISSPHPRVPEKAQVAVEQADHMYRELRIENTLEGENGEKVKLKPGAEVEITISADKSDTVATSGPN